MMKTLGLNLKNKQISIVPICGGNADIDLLGLVAGQFVDETRAGKPAGAIVRRRDNPPPPLLRKCSTAAPSG
jgi:hypothetical protein